MIKLTGMRFSSNRDYFALDMRLEGEGVEVPLNEKDAKEVGEKIIAIGKEIIEQGAGVLDR